MASFGEVKGQKFEREGRATEQSEFLERWRVCVQRKHTVEFVNLIVNFISVLIMLQSQVNEVKSTRRAKVSVEIMVVRHVRELGNIVSESYVKIEILGT